MATSARIDELKKKFDENPRRYFAPLANEYRKAGDVEQAIAICRAYLPQQPGHMSGHIVFGQALFDARQFDEARSVFETALSLDPENLIALRYLGDLSREGGDPAAARSWYQRVLDADPRNEEIAALLASLDGAAPGAPGTDGAAAPATDGATGWGDLNPEHAAGAPVATSAPAPAAPAPAGSGDETPVVAHAAYAPPSAPSAPASTDDIERSDGVELELRDSVAIEAPDGLALERAGDVLTPAEASEPAAPRAPEESAPAASSAAPAPPAAAVPEEAHATQAPEADASPAPASAPASHADDIGLEVMEFTPPDASTTPPLDGLETMLRAEDLKPTSPTEESPAAFVTETMAELYLQQGFRKEALAVYRQLLAQSPEDEGLRERVSQLESGARSSIGMAAISEDVIEEAARRQWEHPRRTARAFFAALAGRRAPRREAAPLVDEPEPPEAEPETVAWEAPVDEGEEVPSGPPLELIMPPEDEPAARDVAPERHAAASPAAPPAPDEEAGSLDALFGDAGVDGDDHAAATALARAYDTEPKMRAVTAPAMRAVAAEPHEAPDGEPGAPEGRPTHAAANELSLENLFRDADRRTTPPRPSGGFSFDQFFSESAGEDGAEPASPAGDGSEAPGQDADGGDDIEQFNSWLEGLKKK